MPIAHSAELIQGVCSSIQFLPLFYVDTASLGRIVFRDALLRPGKNVEMNSNKIQRHAIYWLLIKNPLSRNGHSSRIKKLLSRNFRELHVYLSRGPCWPTTPLMKIPSPPAKLRQRITDHFLIAF